MISEKCKVVIRITNKFMVKGRLKGWLCCYIRQQSNMQRLPDDSSICTAEAKAIDLALDFICIESNEPYQFKESTYSETFRKMS